MEKKKRPLVSVVRSDTAVYDEIDFLKMVRCSLAHLESNSVPIPSGGTVFIKPNVGGKGPGILCAIDRPDGGLLKFQSIEVSPPIPWRPRISVVTIQSSSGQNLSRILLTIRLLFEVVQKQQP
jgi:hypothetical protein